ncbi:MAG: DNA polymerase II [Fibrobacteres bacterium]|nr:DNA polymerase II [Fibrobacterota bacterium]
MIEGFILSASFLDQGRESTRLGFQGRLRDGRRFRWIVAHPRLCFFVERDALDLGIPCQRRPLELKTLRGSPVDALYFASTGDLARARRQAEAMGVAAYEADVSATARHLMERGVRGGVRFLDPPVSEQSGLLDFRDGRVEGSDFTLDPRLLSLDVECTPQGGLFSISLYAEGASPLARVLMLDPRHAAGVFVPQGAAPSEGESSRTFSEPAGYFAYPDERSLLSAFLEQVRATDPDIFIGWNVINFDLRYLAGRCERAGMKLGLGVDGPVDLIEPEGAGGYGRFGSNWLARVPGRAVLDGINMLKAAFIPLEGYSLNAAAGELLGERKAIELEGDEKMAEIERRFREDKQALARYNLLDSVLVHRIFRKMSLAQLAVRKTQLTGLALDRMGGSVAALDFLYLPLLHRKGFVADSSNRGGGEESVPGGLVLDGEAGIHRNVLVLDFKSLYPSLIRTFLIDPLAAAAGQHGWAEGNGPVTWIQGPAGPRFAKEWAILPGIIEHLMEVREAAKRDKDASLSQAVKIIMNSFYGVLGNPGCRFFHPDLAGAITRNGQWVLLESKRWLEGRGHRVLYGDTDSLFVHAPEAEGLDGLKETGARLASELNAHLEADLRARFGAESKLTIQFDKIFLRFFLPSLRKEDRGSKKRYAGLLASGALHFTGLESARSDWTRLAKDFQAALLAQVFRQESLDDPGPLMALARDWNHRLFAGEFDDRLVYSKGLSKDPEEYQGTAPPHVRAARALAADRKRSGREGRIIRYLMTLEGPEPVQMRSGARPDYRHYAEKQLAPIADMVLRFYGSDFARATAEAAQLDLF